MPQCTVFKLQSSALSTILIGLLSLLQSSCTSTQIDDQWPQQAGATGIYKHYEGPDVPLGQLAVLQVKEPIGLLKTFPGMLGAESRDYYYSGSFAIMPGSQSIPLSYFEEGVWGAEAFRSSRYM